MHRMELDGRLQLTLGLGPIVTIAFTHLHQYISLTFTIRRLNFNFISEVRT
jgi:hypothetical protein